MSQSDVRKLLGYSPKDPVILSEADGDDVVDAYRDLVGMAKSDADFEDLVDSMANFLDTVSDMDPDGAIEKRFVAGLKEKVVSDEFRDMIKACLSVVGESRVYDARRCIAESVEDVDAEITALVQGIRMSRDFGEVAAEVSSFLGKLREMNQELGNSIETDLVNGMADFMSNMRKSIMSAAKKMGKDSE